MITEILRWLKGYRECECCGKYAKKKFMNRRSYSDGLSFIVTYYFHPEHQAIWEDIFIYYKYGHIDF